MKKIVLISSYSTDRIFKYNSVNEIDGGPGYFIENVFKKNNLIFENVTKHNKFKIEIYVNNDGETGKIISKNIFRISKNISCENIIISTILDEFLYSDFKYLDCKNLFIDVQGFCRFYKKINYSKFFKGKNIFIKGTLEEVKKISNSFLNKLKNHCLIITNGSNKITVLNKGNKTTYPILKLTTKNTVGAGDTFFANFIVSYINLNNIDISIINAVRKTEIFLLDK